MRIKPLQWTSNRSVQLTVVVVWRHTEWAGSDSVSAVACRTPIRQDGARMREGSE